MNEVNELLFAYAATYFYARMLVRDGSISRYPEWQTYEAGSSRLFPWRLKTAPFGKMSWLEEADDG